MCYCIIVYVARDTIPGIVALPVSLADRTANIEKACDFLKQKGVNLPSDLVKGTHMYVHMPHTHTDTHIVSIRLINLIYSLSRCAPLVFVG